MGIAGSSQTVDDGALLDRALESRRIHSAYLLAGTDARPLDAALSFARALVCEAQGSDPCESCRSCRTSNPGSPDEWVEIDGTGKSGPLFRHIGDHPDLFWVDRGDSTRVRIGQVRAVQAALRLGSHEGGWRAVVIADAEWMNQEAQNALLRLLEEPPERSCLLLVAAGSAGLLATIRSRCQRVLFSAAERPALRAADSPEELRAIVERLDALERETLPSLLDWAEEFRGARAVAAERVGDLLETSTSWLRDRVATRAKQGERHLRRELDAFHVLAECRKELSQRNANPQMVAERALLAMRGAVAR